MNKDGTLLASLDFAEHRVYIYDMTCKSACIVSKAAVDTGLFTACFARRGSVDTLLVCDSFNRCIMEITTSGTLKRVIPVARGKPHSVAYGARNNLIAITMYDAEPVSLLQYDTLAEHATIYPPPSGVHMWGPRGLTFTADGTRLLIADYTNWRVSMFAADDGAFISHVVTAEANGIKWPTDVLQCEDGGIVVVTEGGNDIVRTRLVCVGVNGATHSVVMIPDTDRRFPLAIAYAPSLNGVIIENRDGSVVLRRDVMQAWQWPDSLRCAWVSACVAI